MRVVGVRGRRVRVFPDMRMLSRYNNKCPACEAQIVRNCSWVVPAQLRWILPGIYGLVHNY